MSFDVNAIKTYVANNEKALVGSAILKGKTISLISVQPGVKKSANVSGIVNDATLQAGGCGWSASGTTKVTQRVIETGLVKVNESLCDKDLAGTSLEYELKMAAGVKTLPFEEDFINGKLKSVQAKLEETVWKGDTAQVADNHLKRFDGFIKIINAATGVIDATGTAANPTDKALVAGILDKVYLAMPVEVVTAEDAVIFCGYDVFRAYVMSLRDANLYHFSPENKDQEFIMPGTNVRIMAVNGLNGTKKIYGGQLSNFVFGTDMLGDSEQFKFWYSEDNREFRLAVEFNGGVQVRFPSEITKYLGV